MTARHLYLHVPFCARRCTYCDFAIAVRRNTPVDEYLGAVAREMKVRFEGAPPAEVDTIYLGGGTPSRLGGTGITRLLETLSPRWRAAPGAEVTLEANPDDVDAENAAGWRAAGVTRISLGVQSFDDAVLRWMHRTHDAAQATAAARILIDAGFDDWSLDLIFGLPPEIDRDWAGDLERAIALSPAHLSCYGLTVEEHTPLGRRRARGLPADADEGRFATEFLAAHERLAAAGYEHYEVSNYARTGRRSRHNSAYWLRRPYIGLGPSAHGFDGRSRRWNEREFVAWSRRLAAGDDPVAGTEELAPEQVNLEETYLGLRTVSGVHVVESDRQLFELWEHAGWVRMEGELARPTAQGWLRLDALVGALTDLRSR